MTTKDIVSFLEKKKADFRVLKHREVYTADKIAKACKVPEKSIVKVLFFKATGGKFIIAILPGNLAAKFNKIKKALDLKKLEFATEAEMRKKTGFKPGSAPALGKLLKVLSVADKTLEKSKNIVFPAGDYKTSIEMNSLEWFKLEEPEVLDFSVKPSGKRKARKKASVKKNIKKIAIRKKPAKKSPSNKTKKKIKSSKRKKK